MQQDRPSTFMSQAIHGKAMLLSTYEKELIRAVLVFKKWHSYVLGQTFCVQTDQCDLKYLLKQKVEYLYYISGLLSCWDLILGLNTERLKKIR